MAAAVDERGMMTDQEVVGRVLSGDAASFELIMRRYNRRLYRIARGVLRDDDEAEDAVQEAYIKAYRNLGKYNASGPFSAWLARIALNEALGRLRTGTAERNALSFDAAGEGEEANYMAQMVSRIPDPEEGAARAEVRRLLESAIDSLPDVYRLVFIMCGVEEMSVQETADCLDVEPATVKTRYHRARKILQEHLASLVDTGAGGAYSFDGARCDRIVARVLKRLSETPQAGRTGQAEGGQ
ncbi:RNA polymerase sigma factor [Geomonas sp. Red276]